MATDRGVGDALTVHVVYAEPHSVWEVKLDVPVASTVMEAIDLCGFARLFPDYPFKELAVGIYGQVCPAGRMLVDGDRVEIYRPLSFDPMESRRRRAEHREAFMTKPKNRPKRRKAKLAAERLLSDTVPNDKSSLK